MSGSRNDKALHFCKTTDGEWRPCPPHLCEADRLLMRKSELRGKAEAFDRIMCPVEEAKGLSTAKRDAAIPVTLIRNVVGRVRPGGGAMSVTAERTDWITAIVRDELRHAMEKFPPFNSPHEGKAVIEEELDELWEHVKANTGRGTEAMVEAVQLSAMAMRYVYDLAPGQGPPFGHAEQQTEEGR